MMVCLTPFIKVFDPCQYDTPMYVMVIRKDDNLWWKHTPAVPLVKQKMRTNVKIMESRGGDKFVTYLFSQLFHNIYLYNDLKMDIPQKYFLEGSTMYYFLEVGVDIVTIPLFYRSPFVSILFTCYKDRPALKISVTKISPDTSDPKPKRQRQDG